MSEPLRAKLSIITLDDVSDLDDPEMQARISAIVAINGKSYFLMPKEKAVDIEKRLVELYGRPVERIRSV